jgi:hypothetical protein
MTGKICQISGVVWDFLDGSRGGEATGQILFELFEEIL